MGMLIMDFLAIVPVGGCLGILLAAARVPRWSSLPAFSVLFLLAVAAGAVVSWAPSSIFGGIALVVSALLSSSLYAGRLWMHAIPVLEQPYWSWVWQDVAHPGYLRRAFAEAPDPISV